MKILEASGDYTLGEIMFPSSEASYLKTKTKKRRRSNKLGLEVYKHVPWAYPILIGHFQKVISRFVSERVVTERDVVLKTLLSLS